MADVSNSSPQLLGMDYAKEKQWTFMKLAIGQFISGLIIAVVGVAEFILSNGYYSWAYSSHTLTVLSEIQWIINIIAGSCIVIFSISGMIQALHSTYCTVVINVVMSWFGIFVSIGGMIRILSTFMSSINPYSYLRVIAGIVFIVALVLFAISCTKASKANHGCCCNDDYSPHKQTQAVRVQSSVSVQPQAQSLLLTPVCDEGLQRILGGNGNRESCEINVNPWERQETSNVKQPCENRNVMFSMSSSQMSMHDASVNAHSGP